jgi:hypothetical protein
MYDRLGYRIPAILALSRFLTIESTPSRSRDALQALERSMGSNVTQGKSQNEINVVLTLSSDSKKDEGDFGPAEMGLALGVAVEHTEAKKDLTPFANRVSRYALLAENLASVKGNGFAARYYVPFFAAIHDRDSLSAFVYIVFQSANLPGAAEWKSDHETKLQEYQTWLAAYHWPAPK